MNKLTTTHKILIAGFVLVIATIVGIFVYLQNQKPAPAENLRVVTSQNVVEARQEIEEARTQSFRTRMNLKWSFEDGKSASTDALVGNAETNTYPFYFIVTLADTGEEIYKSDILPVGVDLPSLTLDKELPQGSYKAKCKYVMIDGDGVEIPSNVSFSVTITIKN